MSIPPDVEPLTRDNLAAFDVAPQVAVPTREWALPLGIAGAIGLGVLTFLSMSAGRADNATRVARSAPPPPTAAAAPPQLPTSSAQITTSAPLALAPQPSHPNPLEPPSQNADARLHAPALIVDLSDAEAGNGVDARGVAAAVSGEGMSGDERFAARFGAAQASRARPMTDPANTIAEGVIISAVLETAINSDLPGYVRALVSRDVVSFDGAHVLIPRGSRLVGQYRSGVALGQSRAFVIWTRLMRPDGVTVELNSPGADALGRGGLAGETDRHYLQRFGGGVLLTLLGAAANAAAGDHNTQVVVGVSRGAGDAASVALGEEINISPTVHVDQGTPIRVFVSRDLDFSAVAP